jgi:hypothetical protein
VIDAGIVITGDAAMVVQHRYCFTGNDTIGVAMMVERQWYSFRQRLAVRLAVQGLACQLACRHERKRSWLLLHVLLDAQKKHEHRANPLSSDKKLQLRQDLTPPQSSPSFEHNKLSSSEARRGELAFTHKHTPTYVYMYTRAFGGGA